MTNYGTIPTSSGTGASTEYISRAKERIKEEFGSRRPWKQMLDIRSVRVASSLGEAMSRARANVAFFRVNYAMIALLILFLSLLWHPISLIVFVAMMAAWLFLYFLRDDPLVLFHRRIDDRFVLVALFLLTVVLLLLTKATLNILVALAVAALLVLIHAVLRRTDDLLLDDHPSGLMTGVASSSS